MTTYDPPVPIELPAASRAALAMRAAATAVVFARRLGPVAASRAMGRPADPPDVGRRLRLAFESLGSTYVKFGQLIGSSPGAFGKAVSDEFRACLDTGPPTPFTHVKALVEATTGAPLSETFASFDAEALASASIAVVHRARLKDGREVAVKVLRPGIAEQVAVDLDVMAPLFKRLALAGVPIAGPLYRFLLGFRTQVAEELDLRNEARTMDHFRSLLAESGLDGIVIPAPLPELSGEQVLVMEFLDGVPIDDVDAIAAMGHDPAALIKELLRGWFLTGLRDGMFHGDIHAGNLLLLKDGRAGLIDWGIVARLDPTTHRLFRRFTEAILGDATAWPEIAAFLQEMSPAGPGGGPALSIDDAEREEIEGILTRPFGEVDLTGAFSGPQGPGSKPQPGQRRTRAQRRARRRWLREFRRDLIGGEFAGSSFAQANFLLFKQLLYIERYGKLYLADSALMGDREWLEHVLASSPGGEPLEGIAPPHSS